MAARKYEAKIAPFQPSKPEVVVVKKEKAAKGEGKLFPPKSAFRYKPLSPQRESLDDISKKLNAIKESLTANNGSLAANNESLLAKIKEFLAANNKSLLAKIKESLSIIMDSSEERKQSREEGKNPSEQLYPQHAPIDTPIGIQRPALMHRHRPAPENFRMTRSLSMESVISGSVNLWARISEAAFYRGFPNDNDTTSTSRRRRFWDFDENRRITVGNCKEALHERGKKMLDSSIPTEIVGNHRRY